MSEPFEIFLVVPPGLEPVLEAEARSKGFDVQGVSKGGVSLKGHWEDIWRANLQLRGATRVLVRLASFPAVHLSQLDKKARKLPWGDWLKGDVPFRVDATCSKSKIYHQRAASERISKAITDTIGAPLSEEADLKIKLRIDRNLCTLSIDTSGEPLHKRGHKQALNKAPMRENLAALFLGACGYNGDEPVYDPMCGSGTFVIEAAEIAMGLTPGRSRDFAFESLGSFDPKRVEALKERPARPTHMRFFGSDRDTGAIKMAGQNAERAGVAEITQFEGKPISDIAPPTEQLGLLIVNPPYGGRIGNKKPLFGLYASFGEVVKTRFKGWRVGMVTSEASLAKATGLKWSDTGPRIDHGGIGVKLYQTKI